MKPGKMSKPAASQVRSASAGQLAAIWSGRMKCAEATRLGRAPPCRTAPGLPRSSAATDQILEHLHSLTVSHSSYMLGLLLEAAGTAWQDADEADRETAADGGDGVRHVPLRSDRHHAAGSLRVAQVPRALGG